MNLLEILKKNADNAKSYIDGLVSKKQDTLTFDTAPTEGSQNPVTSDGIQKAIAAKTVDFSNYPTKNGTGATGTWPISISGAATKASQDSNGKVITDTYLKKAGDTATGDITAPNFIGNLKGNADNATRAAAADTLVGSTTVLKNDIDTVNNSDTWIPVISNGKIQHTEKLNMKVGAAVNADAATKATMVNATAPNGGAADLAFGTMALNDYGRIRVGGKNDNGWLEIATADGGNEPIYARQYSGAYDWPNGRPGTVKNEAVLLDGNGNTKFPKNVTAASFTGTLKGNADSATKAKFIEPFEFAEANSFRSVWFSDADTNNKACYNSNIQYNPATSVLKTGTFQGYLNGTASNTTTLNNRGNRNPAANGTKVVSGLNLYQVYNNGYPTTYGNVLSIGGAGGGEILAGWSGTDAGMERLYYRNQRDTGTLAWSAWKTVAYTDDISNYAPNKTGSGASGTWGINITGNAATATTADNATTAGNVSGKIYYSADSPSVATDKLFTIKQAKAGDDNVPNNGLVIQSGPTGAAYNGKLYITDNGGDGVWIGGVASGKEVGWTRLVENKGSWNINSATATTALNIPTSDVGGNIWIA